MTPQLEKQPVLKDSRPPWRLLICFAGLGLLAAPSIVFPSVAEIMSSARKVTDDSPWMVVPWFGFVHPLHFPWIFHHEHGWLWHAGGNDSDGVLFYHRRWRAYFWMTRSTYPFMYIYFRDQSGWHFHYRSRATGQSYYYSFLDDRWLDEKTLASNQPVPPAFALIPAGSFVMGTPRTESGYVDVEMQFPVTLTRAFHLQTTEVTWNHWNEVRDWALQNGYTDLAVGRNGFYQDDSSGNQPVTRVSWFDTIKWLNAKSEKEGLTPCYTVDGTVYRTGEAVPDWNREAGGYRLPTEAEWEYAARAGSTTAFYNGDIREIIIDQLEPVPDPNLDRIGWYTNNQPGTGTQRIGLKEPNAWGLYDMSGNVREWCWDWFAQYPSDATSDPIGPANGSTRITRGGDFNSIAEHCRSASRAHFRPNAQSLTIGFRPARNAAP